eukprot:1716033-Rhodomonas_salina.1
MSEASLWQSDTMIRALAPRSTAGTSKISVTVSSSAGTTSVLFSADGARLSYVFHVNAPATGATSMTILGAGLGLHDTTASVRTGSTAAELTSWVSTSLVLCRVSTSLVQGT